MLDGTARPVTLLGLNIINIQLLYTVAHMVLLTLYDLNYFFHKFSRYSLR